MLMGAASCLIGEPCFWESLSWPIDIFHSERIHMKLSLRNHFIAAVLTLLATFVVDAVYQTKPLQPVDFYRFWLAGRMLSDPSVPPIYSKEARKLSGPWGQKVLEENSSSLWNKLAYHRFDILAT